MVKISERLRTAAGLIGEGERLADVGTDHGYVPIYLVERKHIPSAIAMDIRTGPLERAREHIRMYGMEDYIQTRLSDGVAALKPGEADTILISCGFARLDLFYLNLFLFTMVRCVPA